MKKNDTCFPKGSYAYEKYISPNEERKKRNRNAKRNNWWKSNIWNVLNTILALIAAVTGIISIILQLS